MTNPQLITTVPVVVPPTVGLFAFVYSVASGGPLPLPPLPPPNVYKAHVQYIAALRASRVLIQGGPYDDAIHGQPVIQAVDLTSAQSIASGDPAVRAGALTVVVARWHPRYGTYPPM
ncbi:MAG: hypothetical protein NVS2B16_29710 [Chloroflexota bacterium]